MKNYKPIIIVAGEPNSIFLEIFFKALKKKNKSPIILIASKKLLLLQMKKFKVRKKIKVINHKNLENYKLNNNLINLINVEYNPIKAFEKISNKSNKYIQNSFMISFDIFSKISF